ncbi:MAG: hypothetical protein Q9168_001489 [Polycauliona sp. 1 TL-2023]
MPHDTIGWTGIPSDSSYFRKDEFASPTAPVPERPQGLSEEDALAIRVALPQDFWRCNIKQCDRFYMSVTGEWDKVSAKEKRKWDENEVDGFLKDKLNKALKDWEGVPTAVDGKSQLEQLKDELHARYRRARVEHLRASYEEEVIKRVKSYIREKQSALPE